MSILEEVDYEAVSGRGWSLNRSGGPRLKWNSHAKCQVDAYDRWSTRSLTLNVTPSTVP